MISSLMDALAFRFDFGGFLPRHVLPALIVEYFRDIAKVSGSEIVWQNGVLLRPAAPGSRGVRPCRLSYPHIDFLIKGSDGPLYLGMLRDSVLSTLETMPQLPYEEKVELRPDMRADATDLVGRDLCLDELQDHSRRAETLARHHRRARREGIRVMERVLAVTPVKSSLSASGCILLVFE